MQDEPERRTGFQYKMSLTGRCDREMRDEITLRNLGTQELGDGLEVY
jgi:hypothetical protein